MNELYKEMYKRVDEVLYYVWDPIGVSDEPFARGEYWSYVPSILELVLEHDDPAPIAKRLAEIMRDRLSSKVNKALCEKTATLLLQHKEAVILGQH
jgi:hypothetical protein